MGQFKTLLWLRWLEMKYPFRKSETPWDLFAIGISTLILAPFALLLGIAAGVVGYYIAQEEWHEKLKVIPYFIFGLHFFAYQMANLFDPRRREGFSLDRLMQFPIPLHRLYILNLWMSAADAIFLFFIPSQIAFLFGFLLATGWKALILLPLILIFNFLNLSWSSCLALSLNRLLQSRRVKEFILLFLPLISFFFIFAPSLIRREIFNSEGTVSTTVPFYLKWTPGGWLGQALEVLLAGYLPVLSTLLLLIGAGLGYILGYAILSRELVQSSSHSKKNQDDSNKDHRNFFFSLPLSPGLRQGAAIWIKEFKYLIRSSQGRYAFIWPPLFIGMLWFYQFRSPKGSVMVDFFAPYSLISMVSFLFLFLLPLFVNIFAYDRSGIQCYALMPIRMWKVLLTKNLALGALGMLCLFESIFFYILLLGFPGFQIVRQGLMGYIYGFPLLVMFGNLLSIYFPKPLHSTAVRGNNPPHSSVFLGLFLVSISTGLLILCLFMNRLGGLYLGMALEISLILIFVILYCSLIPWEGRLCESRMEHLIDKLSRHDIQD